MNLYLPSGLLLLALGHTQAIASDHAKAPPSTDAAVSMLPISMEDSEPRAPLRLREAVRHPLDELEDSGKPYRLSVEQRHRLREQLRSQTANDPKK